MAAPAFPDATTIVVKPGAPLEPGTEVPVLISVKTPRGTAKTPSDICCVLDISGSMGTEATIMGAGGSAESHGLSLLDVAKHGIKTVLKTLGPEDRLTLVTFNTQAATIMPLTAMDEAGQQGAEARLEHVQAGGGTNIWNGLFAGMEALRNGVVPGRLAHVMLLTDGESQERDKIVPNLLQYKQTYERLPGTISTFGFGYNIDSSLLVRLASAGDGSYSFIPDAGFVGTVFVNTLSNLLVTMAREVYLSLEPEEGASILAIQGGYQAGETSSWGMRIGIGTLQYEQAKDVIVIMRVAGPQPYLTVSGAYESVDGSPGAMPAVEGQLEPECVEVGIQTSRARYVDAVTKVAEGLHAQFGSAYPAFGQVRSNSRSAGSMFSAQPLQRSDSRGRTMRSRASGLFGSLRRSLSSERTGDGRRGGCGGGPRAPDPLARKVDTLEDAQALLVTLGQLIDQSEAAATPQVVALLEDVRGQTTEAISREDWYRKWGRHYVPSIMFAHKLEQCNNFKDPGVQGYGGPLFQDVRDTGDDIFNKLPAPKASIRRMSQMGAASQQPVSMAAYNDRYAGCIDGACEVRLASGEARLIRDLKRGDLIEAPGNATAEVVCLVRTTCRGGRAFLVELPGGARLTPYHPVMLEGSWVFPADLAAETERPCDAVYNLVLAGAAALVVSGVACAALGHGLEEGAARHAYFGSRRAVEDVAKLAGFESGLVRLPTDWAERDPDTGLVCGMRPLAEEAPAEAA